jgi:hypothetical protein
MENGDRALDEAFKAAPPKAKPAGRPGQRGKGPARKAAGTLADPQSEEIERLRRQKGQMDDLVSRLVSDNDALERRLATLEKQIRRVTDGMDRAYEPMRGSGDDRRPSFREFFNEYRRART